MDIVFGFTHIAHSESAEAAYPGSDVGAATPGGATAETSEAATAGEEKVPFWCRWAFRVWVNFSWFFPWFFPWVFAVFFQ